ncbi:hypothetical protein MASR2M48_27520 [Spirochaetota bacterium]
MGTEAKSRTLLVASESSPAPRPSHCLAEAFEDGTGSANMEFPTRAIGLHEENAIA